MTATIIPWGDDIKVIEKLKDIFFKSPLLMTTESVQMLFILPLRSTSQVCKAAHGHLFQNLKKNLIILHFHISYLNIDKGVYYFFFLQFYMRDKRCPSQMKLKLSITD